MNKRNRRTKNIKNTNFKKKYEIPEQFVFLPTTEHSSKENKKAELLTDDIIIIGIILILIIERINLKKEDPNNKNLSDYDLMIAALIYIYF